MNKIIHQTWKDRKPPDDLFKREWALSWRIQNPGWGYRLWTDQEILDFVREEFPSFFPVWCSYPKQIMRVDAWRYLLLKQLGGFYVDLDMACLRPLSPWIERFHGFACADQGDGNLCNALMWASGPDSPFLNEIEPALVASAYHLDPLEATGPIFLQRYAVSRMHLLSQFPTKAVFPITVWDRNPLIAARETPMNDLRRTFADAVAISFWTGSWTRQPNSIVIDQDSNRVASTTVTDQIMVAVMASPNTTPLLSAHESFYGGNLGMPIEYWRTDTPGHEANLGLILKRFVESGKSWLFLCSETTYFVPERIASLIFTGADFITNEGVLVTTVPNRDAGYLVSRNLATDIVISGKVRSEADFCSYLAIQKPHIQVTPMLRHEAFRFPMHSNRIASTVFKDARQFQIVPRLLEAGGVETIKCSHQIWCGDLVFFEEGGCIRPETGCCGFWEPISGGHRRIKWFEWPEEVMFKVAEGRGFLVHGELARPLFE